MVLPDFANLPLESVFALLVLFALFDIATAVAIALVAGNFEGQHLLDFMRTHVLARVFPIFAFAVIGHGLVLISLPPIPAAGLAATGLLGLYGIEVLLSIKSSFGDRSIEPKPTGVASSSYRR